MRILAGLLILIATNSCSPVPIDTEPPADEEETSHFDPEISEENYYKGLRHAQTVLTRLNT